METKQISSPFMVIEEITPSLAQAYLETSIGNRKVRDGAKIYARIMKEGGWVLNGVPIVFDLEGHLMDGHNRLEAITLAGVPVKMSVVRGVPRDYFTSFDCGFRRTANDILYMAQIPNNRLIASLIACGETIKVTGKLGTRGKYAYFGVNNDKVLKVYKTNPELFHTIAEMINRLKSRVNLIQGSLMGGMMYYLVDTGKYDLDYVYKFFEMLNSTDEASFKPCDLLRKRIIKAKISGLKMGDIMLAVLMTKAWNSYVLGHNKKQLPYEQGEVIPLLLLNNKVI